MAKLTFKRCEKKLLISDQQFKNMLDKMTVNEMSYDSYCESGKIYKIYNLYFDDDNNSVIRRSLRRPKFKEKFRIRAYSIPKSDSDPVYLEIKRKVTGVVVKRRVCVSYGEANAFISNGVRPKSDKYLANKVLDEIEYYFKCNKVYPKLFLSYERVAFYSKSDPNFRVTFDKNILTRRYDLDLSLGAYGDQLLDDGEILMEIKISGAIPKWFVDILSEERIYISGFSKYGNEYTKYKGHDFTHIKDRHLTPLTSPKSDSPELSD